MRNSSFGRRLSPLLAVAVLAAGMLLATGGPAQALSGFASDQPAVHAQYPDAAGFPAGQKPAVTTLANVMHINRQIDRNPERRARNQAAQKQIRRRTTAALASAPGLSPPESGSAILLIAAIAVMAVGGALRWRRGLGDL